MVILLSQNKITDFFMILARASTFKFARNEPLIVKQMFLAKILIFPLKFKELLLKVMAGLIRRLAEFYLLFLLSQKTDQC